jgi:hypothetical protein
MTMGTRRLLCFDALRRSRAAIVALALLGLLFAQAALAFYSCPQLLSGQAQEQPEPPCAEMDMESPALCKAFVQGDTQGLDGPRAALDVSSAALVVAVLPVPAVAVALARASGTRFERPHARPPPLWIWFGRFRD